MMTGLATRAGSFRALFPHTNQGKLYFNHAGTAPLSTRVVEAISKYLFERSGGRIENYSHDLPMVAECRSLIAGMINAESHERIALTANTSDAINVVASGLRWRTGDRILLNDLEFPANVWPFLNLRRRGVNIDVVNTRQEKIGVKEIERSMTPRTRMVALSAVQFLSGYRADLAAIGDLCRARKVLFAVDGIQAVGAIRVDVQGMKIDALSAGGQKWQTAPHGTGFLYLTENLQEQIEQSSLGWLAVENPWDFNNFEQPVASTARRYEGGSLNMPGLWGYHAALSTLHEFGFEAIEVHLGALTGELLRGFSEIPGVTTHTSWDDAERAGIVTISLDAVTNPALVFQQLLERRVTPAVRQGLFRFSPHFYMTREEMSATVDILKECLSG
jgi:selenocysteine lyase/cysteine desulfurase